MKAAKKIPQHNTIKENRHQSNDEDDDDGVAGKVITVCEKRLIELICDCEYLFFGGDSLFANCFERLWDYWNDSLGFFKQ